MRVRFESARFSCRPGPGSEQVDFLVDDTVEASDEMSINAQGLSVDFAIEGKFPARQCVVSVNGAERHRQDVPYPPDFFPCEGGLGNLNTEDVIALTPLKAIDDGQGWTFQYRGVDVARLERERAKEGFNYEGPIAHIPEAQLDCNRYQTAAPEFSEGGTVQTFTIELHCDAWKKLSGDSVQQLGCVRPSPRFTVTRPTPLDEFGRPDLNSDCYKRWLCR